MRTVTRLTLSIGLLAAVAITLPAQVHAQRSGVEIWANVCGRCHTIQPPSRYTAKDWTSILSHMAVNARLTSAQQEAVLEFLTQGARPSNSGGGRQTASITGPSSGAVRFSATTVQLSPDVKETFTSLCAPCHGTGGKGDGPAAVAFDPKPADFTKAELWKDRTDDDLFASITNGVRMMPPFSAQLQPDQIRALVSYVRSLSGDSVSAHVGKITSH